MIILTSVILIWFAFTFFDEGEDDDGPGGGLMQPVSSAV